MSVRALDAAASAAPAIVRRPMIQTAQDRTCIEEPRTPIMDYAMTAAAGAGVEQP